MTPSIVVMGVSGSGKSTLGKLLAQALDRPFIEGDDLHPAANLAKMSRGEPLSDEDRVPFLNNVGKALRRAPSVASCSALKRIYRDRLRAIAGDLLFILPVLSRPELERRIGERPGHFMPLSLLDSQLSTLELPAPDETAILIDGAVDEGRQLSTILMRLRQSVDSRAR